MSNPRGFRPRTPNRALHATNVVEPRGSVHAGHAAFGADRLGGGVRAPDRGARARLGGIGIHQLGVVTPAERPVRAIAVIIAILASAIFGGNSATVVAIALTAMQTFSVLQVLRVTYQQLR